MKLLLLLAILILVAYLTRRREPVAVGVYRESDDGLQPPDPWTSQWLPTVGGVGSAEIRTGWQWMVRYA